MTSLTPIYLWRSGGYGARQVLLLVKDASADDTVTIDELDTIIDTVALNANTHAAVACTESTNIVTIDSGGSLSSTDVRILVGGH